MAESIYHAVGYLPYTKELVSFGVATTKADAESMLKTRAANYSKYRAFPVRCAVLKFRVDATSWLDFDSKNMHLDLNPAPIGRLRPVPAALADGQYTDVASFGSHPGRFA
jgi:hypothetical protein